MKKLLLFLFCVPFLGITQNSHIINTVGSTFSPSNLTISVGDTVTWNNTGGYHNVNGTQATYPNNPQGFGNGVAGSPWTFQWIFTIAGTYDYQCDPHAPGMSGVIIVNVPVQLSTVNLFFSEYGEGSGNNKYFEIYNPTADTVDLTDYAFARVNNSPGNGVGVYEYWIDFDPGSVILPNDVYVVVHPSSDPFILSEADMDYGSLSNGDDGFALVYGNNPGSPMSPSAGGYQILDWIGDWNGDPGSGWNVAGVIDATLNHTLVRKCAISQGDTSWTNAAGTDSINSQWIVLSQDDWTDIGSHIVSCNLFYGCTDSTACNYDSLSTVNDGSCVYPSQVYQNNVTICNGQTYVIGSHVYDSAGTYIDSLSSSFSCDSIVHTNLTMYSQFLISGGIPNTTVGGGSFYSGQQNLELSCYMSSELVSAVVYSADTILTTFEIRDDNGNVLYGITVNVIPGGHRIYFNYNMSAGSNYELGVNGSSNDLFRHNSGVNYPYNFGSLAAVTSSSAGGNYYYFFYDIQVIGNSSSFTNNYSICDGESISVAGNIYDSTGFYIDSLTSSIGCDSLVFTHLLVHPHVFYTNNQTICIGEIYSIGSNIYDSTGVYQDTLSTIFGCDSIVTTNLTVLAITGAPGVNHQTICLGDSALVGSSIYYSPGVYSDTLTSSNGCDSLVTTTLTVLSGSATYNTGLLNSSAAPGDFSNYDGYLNLDVSAPSILKSATIYSEDTNSVTFELRDNNGVILDDVTHAVYPGSQSLIFNFALPTGNDFQLGVDGSPNIGLFRSNAGNGNSLPYPFDIGGVSITSANDNFSTQYYYYYYDIEIITRVHFQDVFICEGDNVILSGNVYDSPTTITETFTSLNSCDSVVCTILDYYQIPSLYIQSVPDPPDICLGDSVILEGSDGFDVYWWTDANDNIILINNRLVDFPTSDTWYMLSAEDSNGCVSREDIWVYVDSCITGLNEESLSNINIYPNPSTGIFTVEFKKVKENNSNISIVNSIGNVVFSEELKIGDSLRKINLSDFSKGIYLIELQTELGVYKKKIILQ